MALAPLDEEHFYLDEQLIDLVWIKHVVKAQMTGGNHHDIKRNLGRLRSIALYLLNTEATEIDYPAAEKLARRALLGLGCGWYFERLHHHQPHHHPIEMAP